ncbi:translation elongation factor P [Aphanomyces invadans]|uniref:Translation elongation factor P n=1 Tax=Aphanomyces invadans TaxID=157072 RepID=A0A024TWR0_9STRA|nr:translation elongation factor P [Aphanomyces invadans]ETV98433.1 translation elongation factor P [Aphanomyces invadans]|eukprot:XP_008872630.1 translation elongation factor P [Aphanomyces invadans]
MLRAACSRVVAGTTVLRPFARSVHITGNQVRPGVAIEVDGKLYRVVKSQSVKPGKGVAYMQAELKELTTGHKINRRFRSSESVKKAPLTKDRSFQFLYNDGNKLVLMEPSTFEQLEVGTDILQENQLKYLSEGTMVTLQIVEGTPLWMNLPDHVVHIVEKTVPGAGNGKEATLTNGTQVHVPAAVEVGDSIKISSDTGLFVEVVAA